LSTAASPFVNADDSEPANHNIDGRDVVWV
jgi:hypothetical protein